MANVSVKVAVDAPLEFMWSAVTDIEKYPEFVKEVKEVRIVSRDGDRVTADYTVELIQKTIKYTVDLDFSDRFKKMTWKLISGDLMSKNEGSWVFDSVGEKRCVATYSADVVLNFILPGSVVSILEEINLPKMLDAFKKRAEALLAAHPADSRAG
jgi:ribosome-associated toxin RatA of RatAB toxin-antitoxin module